MLIAALVQWIVLDGSLSALLSASITSIGGPLSELPFVGYGIWEYLDSSKDYFPLQNIQQYVNNIPLLSLILNGDNYSNLGLSSITGPCYFAVTMDAIALGRWFDSSATTTTTSQIPGSNDDNTRRQERKMTKTMKHNIDDHDSGGNFLVDSSSSDSDGPVEAIKRKWQMIAKVIVIIQLNLNKLNILNMKESSLC